MKDNNNNTIYKSRLHYTKQLLKNYTYMKRSIELSNVKECESEAEEGVGFIKIIQESKSKTLSVIEQIERVVEAYKDIAYKSDDLMVRRYLIIHNLYINNNKLTIEEIAELNNCATRTVDRDIDKAIGEVAVLLFGADGINIK